jgi:inhibitor of nuclear factor kappa-B kinase subunit alpha
MLAAEDRNFIAILRREKGWGAKKILSEFPNKPWTLATLKRWLQRIDATGLASRKIGSGRRRTARIPGNIDFVRQAIVSPINAHRKHFTPRQIAPMLNVSHSSVRRIISKDLRMRVFKRVPVTQLTADDMNRRRIRGQQLLERFNDRTVQRIFFTDEKLFTVSPVIVPQNDRVYSTALVKRHVRHRSLVVKQSHFSPSVMVAVGISMKGKSRIIFVPHGQSISADYYCDHMLSNGFLPDCQRIFGNWNYTFQQDSASSHRAQRTITFLRQNVPDLISPDEWPPKSPDLNPVDYFVWGVLQKEVYSVPIRDLQHLKERILQRWNALPQQQIDSAIRAWRNRLQICVRENGAAIDPFRL